MINCKVDTVSLLENIKPMNCCGGGPKTRRFTRDATELFKEMGIKACRLHDIEYPYGTNQFVDIHCIFPNFDADEYDAKNYNFTQTDKYLLAIKECGAEVFYRLGESIDHFDLKLFVSPPKDYAKWARICEHIIRHYNQGWANGYYLNITKWEIWNEPEGRCMWKGTYEQFYELYVVTAKHLKACFPDLEIGGYSSSGVYSETREELTEWFKTLVPFMNGFFDYIKDKDVPLDFFSWHCYALNPNEIELASNFVRKYLDEKGYTKTKSYLTELNFIYSFFTETALVKKEQYISDLLGTLIVGQNSPVDMMFYYDLQVESQSYNGMFAYNELTKSMNILPGYYAMYFFEQVSKLKNRIKIDYSENQDVYILGASENDKIAIAIADRNYSGEIKFDFSGVAVDGLTLTKVDFLGNKTEQNLSVVGQSVSFYMDEKCIYLLNN